MSLTEQTGQSMELWLEEKHSENCALKFKVKKVLFSGESEFQHVDVVETESHGRMLLNDGLIMITERDEHVYHEMMAHVPLHVHPNPQRVLVIGGGDGGTVREVLRHPEVKECVLVEIDGFVVDACKEYIPQTAACLDDPRVTVKIADGVEYVKQMAQKGTEKFDVIMIDSTDPFGPAAPLFSPEFYADVKVLLGKDGIVVSQAESPYYEMKAQKYILRVLAEKFSHLHLYNYSNLTYPGGLWSFSFASNRYCPIKDLRREKWLSSPLETKYYNSQIHQGAFLIPQFIRKEHEGVLSDFQQENL